MDPNIGLGRQKSDLGPTLSLFYFIAFISLFVNICRYILGLKKFKFPQDAVTILTI